MNETRILNQKPSKELIIDMHVHIYPTTLARRAMAVAGREHDDLEKLPVKENLWKRMEEEEITLSVVQHVTSKPATQTDVNRFAKEIVRTNVISFGGLHPDCENVLEEIEKLKDLNMAGVKFHPPFQRVHLDDEKYIPMWQRISHLGFPVLIHCGRARGDGEYDLFPSGVAKFIKYLPDVPVVLAHMGGRSGNSEEEQILFGLPENVYIDTAMSAERQPQEDFERLASAMGPERVIFGSDFPYGTQKAAIAFVRNSKFSEHEKAMMLGGNAVKILGENHLLPKIPGSRTIIDCI
ncbi:MAG: hypothetical protein E7246_00355 [Lachnoclostridium sp.]|nr:hypothetical protein [Lachnoclostridium sp.]